MSPPDGKAYLRLLTLRHTTIPWRIVLAPVLRITRSDLPSQGNKAFAFASAGLYGRLVKRGVHGQVIYGGRQIQHSLGWLVDYANALSFIIFIVTLRKVPEKSTPTSAPRLQTKSRTAMSWRGRFLQKLGGFFSRRVCSEHKLCKMAGQAC